MSSFIEKLKEVLDEKGQELKKLINEKILKKEPSEDEDATENIDLDEDSDKRDAAEVDEDDEDEEVDDEKVAKKKKVSKIIQGVIAVLISIYAFDEFVLLPEREKEAALKKQQEEQAKLLKKKREEKKKKQELEKQEQVAVAEESPQADVQPSADQKQTEELSESDIPEENVPSVLTSETEEPEPEPESESEVPTVEETPEKVVPAAGEVLDPDMGEFQSAEETPVISEQIVQETLEKVEPPEKYENYGRGLVYSCSKQHWACVDRETYMKCRDHQNWSESNGSKSLCVSKDVYKTIRDCRIMQIHNINTVQQVGECN